MAGTLGFHRLTKVLSHQLNYDHLRNHGDFDMTMNLKAVTTCFGYQQITDLSASAALTVPVKSPEGLNAKPVFALIVAEGAPVRWRDDGTAPSATVGMPVAVGVPLQYDGDLTKIRFIQQSSSGILNISYYS